MGVLVFLFFFFLQRSRDGATAAARHTGSGGRTPKTSKEKGEKDKTNKKGAPVFSLRERRVINDSSSSNDKIKHTHTHARVDDRVY